MSITFPLVFVHFVHFYFLHVFFFSYKGINVTII